MECSICLDIIKEKDKFTLSCNHAFHYQCFLSLVNNKGGNIFINCPLCREMNYNNQKIHDSPLDNIKELSRVKRCSHYTKKGNKCKNKCHILNYGYCYTHNKNVLPKEKYSLMCDYLYWLMETSNNMRTKIFMTDISKKLLIQNPTITTIQGIQHYFFRFYHTNGKTSMLGDNLGLHKYYNLEFPPEDWVQECLDKKTII